MPTNNNHNLIAELQSCSSNLSAAIEIAEEMESFVPPILMVGFLQTVPGATHDVRKIRLAIATAAWREASIRKLLLTRVEKEAEGLCVDFDRHMKFVDFIGHPCDERKPSLKDYKMRAQDSYWIEVSETPA